MCDVADKADMVLDCVNGRKQSVKTIVLMEMPSEELVSKGQEAQIEIDLVTN